MYFLPGCHRFATFVYGRPLSCQGSLPTVTLFRTDGCSLHSPFTPWMLMPREYSASPVVFPNPAHTLVNNSFSITQFAYTFYFLPGPWLIYGPPSHSSKPRPLFLEHQSPISNCLIPMFIISKTELCIPLSNLFNLQPYHLIDDNSSFPIAWT